MTNAFLRACRDGKWQPVEVEHLTPEERTKEFKDRPKEEIMRWLEIVCVTLAETEAFLKKEGYEER